MYIENTGTIMKSNFRNYSLLILDLR